MITTKIERDVRRFRQIVRGRIRKDLKKYMSSGELIGRKGKDYVSIPLPQIQLPKFRYGDNEESATDVLNYVASIFARGDAKSS